MKLDPIQDESIPYVLHIDDEPDQLEVVRRIAELRGTFRVESAQSSLEGINMVNYRPFRYAAIISDYEILDLTGVALIALIKQNYPRCPVAVMTGHSSDEVKNEIVRVGASYIPKSVEADELMLRIEALIEGRTCVEPRCRATTGALVPIRTFQDMRLIEIPAPLLASMRRTAAREMRA
ncbi:MAG: response regulator [Pyrinomonadaceae bacterium]